MTVKKAFGVQPPQGMMMFGGDRGGDRGGRGGFGRGGFDASSMLSRMDSNGNGQLDPEEMQGPARMFLERMAAGNPNINLSKPIPLATITGEFEKMRGERGGGGGFGGGGGGWFGGESEEAAAPEIRPLVKGFGEYKKPDVPLGFGPKAEVNATKVESQDRADAEERIRRYDRNRDQFLDEEELKSGRWTDSPLQYDRNGDKKLNVDELAVRYARVRLAGGNNASGDKNGDDRSGRGRRGSMFGMGLGGGESEAAATDKPAEPAKQKSFRSLSETKKTAGLPSWFVDSDLNKDKQVALGEFANKIDEAAIEEFVRFDTNTDGFITAQEVLWAIKNNILRSTVASRSGGSSEAGAAPSTTTTAGAAAGLSELTEVQRQGLPDDVDEKWLKFALRRFNGSDANRNGTLSGDEWPAAEGDFSKVDTNGDGMVTLAEFYQFKKSSKAKK